MWTMLAEVRSLPEDDLDLKGDDGCNSLNKTFYEQILRRMKRSKIRKKTKPWVATRGGLRSAGSSPWPNYRSFKTPLPKVVDIPSKGTPRNKIKNGERAMTNYDQIGMHNLENVHTPAFASLLQQILFATSRVRDNGALGSQAALSPLSLNALDGGTPAYEPLQPAPSAGVKHLVVRLSSLKTPTATLRNSIMEKHEESVTETESENASGIVIWSNAAFCPDISSDKGSNSIVIKSNFHQSQANPSPTADYEVGKGPRVRSDGDGLQDGLAQKLGKIAGGAVPRATSGATKILPRIDESCSMLEFIGGHVMSGCAGSSSLVSHLVSPRMKSASVVPQPRRRSMMMTVSSPAVNRSTSSSAATSDGLTVAHQVEGGSRCDCHQVVSASSVWCTQSETEPTSERRGTPATGQKRRKGRKLLESGAKKPSTLQNWHKDENKDLQEMQASKPVLCSTNERQPLDKHLWPPFDNFILPGRWIRKGRQTFDAVPRNRWDYRNHQTPGSGPSLTTEGKLGVEQFKNREKSERGDQDGMPQPISPPILLNVKTCSSDGETDLDAEIQRQLEDEIAREILVLSQKLANLQTRYGVRRAVQSSSKLAVLSCPQTPLLLGSSLPKDEKEDSLNTSRSMASEAITYTQKGRSKLYNIKNHNAHAVCKSHADERTREDRKCPSHSGAVGASGQIPKRGNNTGAATFATSNKQPHSNGLSNMAVHASFTRGNATPNRCHSIPCRGNDHNLLHGKSQTGEASLEESLNSKVWDFARSFRRGGAGKPIDDPEDNTLHLDDLSNDMAARCPDSNKRFDWVKMLRSSGIGLHGSSERGEYFVSPPNHESAPEKESSGIDAAQKNVRELANFWCGDDCDTAGYSGVSTNSATKSVQASGTSPVAATEDVQEHQVTLLLKNQDDHDGTGSLVKRGPEPGLEHRPMKSGKKSASPSDDVGALDSRTALHLLKAGLRRVPSFKTTLVSSPFPSNLRSKSKSLGSRSSKKDGGKRLKKRCRGDVPKKPVPEKKEDERVNDLRMMDGIPGSEELQEKEETKQKAAEWQKPEMSNYEAEYETFVEASDESRHSCEVVDACREPLGVSGGLSGGLCEDKDSKRSPSCISTHEKWTLSEAPVVTLVKIPQSTKKTFIRCIELVGAIRNKELPKASQRKSLKIGHSPSEGTWPRRRNGRAEKTFGKLWKGRDDSKYVHNKGHGCQKTQSVAGRQMAREQHGYEENAVCTFLSKGVVVESVLASVVARESVEAFRGPSVSFGKRNDAGKRMGHQDIFQQLGSGGDGQCDASQPLMSESRSSLTTFSTSKRAETVTACPPVGMNPLKTPISTLSMGPVSLILEKNLTCKVEHLTASVRARWEDALEKERLGLPKIRTGSSDAAAILTTSPRDSGCVKRIAEQVKAIECFNLEDIGKPALFDKGGVQIGNVEEASLQINLNKCQHWWKIQQKQAVVF